MNRSRYLPRPLDATDRAIIDALAKNGRMTVRELAAQIGLSSSSATERIRKLEDAGAINGYTIAVDTSVFGLGIGANVGLGALHGEVKRLGQMSIVKREGIDED